MARVSRLAEPSAPRTGWIDDLRALALPDGPFGQVVAPAILMELIDLLGERLAALPLEVSLMVDGIVRLSPTRCSGACAMSSGA